jgi:hypothetical protein
MAMRAALFMLRCAALLLLLTTLLMASPSLAVTIDWVQVGNPGNAADTPSTNCYAASCGSVASSYFISKYEVTNAQYVEFLNAKAAADPLLLYSPFMDTNPTGGITRSGISGSYTYAVTVRGAAGASPSWPAQNGFATASRTTIGTTITMIGSVIRKKSQ